MTAAQIASARDRSEAWARAHGAAFYNAAYPNGIPSELLASYGIWTEPEGVSVQRCPASAPGSPVRRRKRRA